MDTNFSTSAMRVHSWQSRQLSYLITSDTDKLRVQAQGKKRVAVWGFDWSIQGFHEETPENAQAYIRIEVVHYLPNGKYRIEELIQRTAEWKINSSNVGSQAVPSERSGTIMFPVPFLIQRGEVRFTVSLNACTAYASIGFTIKAFLSDALLKNDEGDIQTSVRFNRGNHRNRNTGQRYAAMGMRGGPDYL